MIVVNVVVETSAENIATMQAAVAEMEAASRAETGCIDYTFCVELNDPSRLRVVENWADVAALTEHFRTPHMAAFNTAMSENPPSNVAVKCYEVKEIPLPRP